MTTVSQNSGTSESAHSRRRLSDTDQLAIKREIQEHLANYSDRDFQTYARGNQIRLEIEENTHTVKFHLNSESFAGMLPEALAGRTVDNRKLTNFRLIGNSQYTLQAHLEPPALQQQSSVAPAKKPAIAQPRASVSQTAPVTAVPTQNNSSHSKSNSSSAHVINTLTTNRSAAAVNKTQTAVTTNGVANPAAHYNPLSPAILAALPGFKGHANVAVTTHANNDKQVNHSPSTNKSSAVIHNETAAQSKQKNKTKKKKTDSNKTQTPIITTTGSTSLAAHHHTIISPAILAELPSFAGHPKLATTIHSNNSQSTKRSSAVIDIDTTEQPQKKKKTKHKKVKKEETDSYKEVLEKLCTEIFSAEDKNKIDSKWNMRKNWCAFFSKNPDGINRIAKVLQQWRKQIPSKNAGEELRSLNKAACETINVILQEKKSPLLLGRDPQAEKFYRQYTPSVEDTLKPENKKGLASRYKK